MLHELFEDLDGQWGVSLYRCAFLIRSHNQVRRFSRGEGECPRLQNSPEYDLDLLAKSKRQILTI